MSREASWNPGLWFQPEGFQKVHSMCTRNLLRVWEKHIKVWFYHENPNTSNAMRHSPRRRLRGQSLSLMRWSTWPDGSPFAFYQKYWDIVRRDFCKMVWSLFEGNRSMHPNQLFLDLSHCKEDWCLVISNQPVSQVAATPSDLLYGSPSQFHPICLHFWRLWRFYSHSKWSSLLVGCSK